MATTTKTTKEEVGGKKVIKIYSIVYRVESATTKGKFYTVIVKDGGPISCTCPAFEYHKNNRILCSHMNRVMESIDTEEIIDATERKERLTTAGAVGKSWREDEYSY